MIGSGFESMTVSQICIWQSNSMIFYHSSINLCFKYLHFSNCLKYFHYSFYLIAFFHSIITIFDNASDRQRRICNSRSVFAFLFLFYLLASEQNNSSMAYLQLNKLKMSTIGSVSNKVVKFVTLQTKSKLKFCSE